MRSPPAVLLLIPALLCPALPAPGQTAVARASESSLGVEGNATSRNGRISGNGAFVVFYGGSTNLVPGDTNGVDDVFRKDTTSGALVRVSVPSGGAGQGNGPSSNCDLSEAGDAVVFESYATNLVPGDANFSGDVFWHHAASQTTTVVSLANGGSVQGNGHSAFPSCDDTGNLIAFESVATNLAGADTNGVKDIYLRDRTTGTTERISLTQGGVEPDGECRLAAVSPDGLWVAFDSAATNLVPGDTNGVTDVFLKDRKTGVITRVSVGTGGVQGNRQSRYPALSYDAAVIAFASESTNWIPGTTPFFDVYVHDRATGATTLVSRHSSGAPSNSTSVDPDISRSGRWVVFYSYATNLVQADTNGFADVFLNDTLTGATTRLSMAPGGVEANGFSGPPALSDDGIRAAFESDASNLIAADLNGQRDVFYVDACGAPPSVYCTGKLNSAGCVPVLSTAGTPSAGSPAPFDLIASLVVNNKNGLLFYGLAPASAPFSGGIKCVQAPTKRTPLQGSNGSAPPDDCTGVFTYDFNQRIQSGVDPDLVAGTTVYAQYYYRDPASSFNTGLTPAACFTIQP
jgi:Tol biopolymer transport system component